MRCTLSHGWHSKEEGQERERNSCDGHARHMHERIAIEEMDQRRDQNDQHHQTCSFLPTGQRGEIELRVAKNRPQQRQVREMKRFTQHAPLRIGRHHQQQLQRLRQDGGHRWIAAQSKEYARCTNGDQHH